MIKLFFYCCLMSFLPTVNLKFVNKNPNSTFPKLEVVGEKTIIYRKNGNELKPAYTFNQVPRNVNNEDMRSVYKITVTENHLSDKITVEISYILYRQTNQYTAYLKITTHNTHQKNNKITEDYFEIKT